MTNHCFISYSNADGLDFATKLADELEGGYPFIKAWFEKREMAASGDDWDDQLSSAISGCKCFLFVMSADSTAKGSNCKEEWAWALKYKKPVICLLLDEKAEDQFRLNSRQKIEFTSNFDAGMAHLRKAIARLDTPEGQLDELRHRFADANRDLRRAKDEDKPRIQAEIEELKKQIETQQKIVDNPKAAQAQTQKNIETGLERERQPEKPATKSQSTKFINPPPGIAPNWFQDRKIETEQVINFLKDDAQRLMTIVGRGGVGKTAMVCRLLKGLESGELPDGLGAMKVEGIVYLSESGSHRVNFANIFYDLCKLLPAETANELDAVYKNPQGSTESKMCAVLEKFTGGRVVLLLDNFEPLVDTETFAIRDAELDEALRAFLQGIHTSVNIVSTTRVAPKPLNLLQPGRQRVLILDEGLESPYAENILREMDADGKLGLKNAPAAVLAHAREHTRGYPRALEALFAILASDRYTSLEEILNTAENYLPENVVQAYVGEAFNRLDTNAQKVMQALAVYNRPVTPAAVDYLLAPHIPAIDSAPILQRLANMHFARKESGRFYLHPVDREFAFGLVPVEDLTAKTAKDAKENQKAALTLPKYEDLFKTSRSWRASRFDAFSKHDLTSRAADYFRQARKPRTEWKKLDDLSAQLAEFDLRCAAGDYDTAASVLTEIDFDYLFLWGHYRLMIELHEKLNGKLKSPEINRISNAYLGMAYQLIGEVQNAIEHYEIVLRLAQKEKNKQHEGATLGNLGQAYIALGNTHKAIDFHQQALLVTKEVGDHEGEGRVLGNLGTSFAILGDTRKAIEYFQQALDIAREIGDYKGEGTRLGNIADCYYELGETKGAIDYCEQALAISRKILHRDAESIFLGNLGGYYIDYGNTAKSIAFCSQSIYIADEIGVVQIQNGSRLRLAEAYLIQNDLTNARTTIEAALQYDVPEYNHNASTLHGIIALRQGEEVAARGAFVRAIGQADEILSKTAEYYSALDAKGLALCGSALCRSRLQRDNTPDIEEPSRSKRDLQDAIETFRKARKIAPHAGVVKSVLRLFDELAKCDPEGVLKEVRAAVEGKE